MATNSNVWQADAATVVACIGLLIKECWSSCSALPLFVLPSRSQCIDEMCRNKKKTIYEHNQARLLITLSNALIIQSKNFKHNLNPQNSVNIKTENNWRIRKDL